MTSFRAAPRGKAYAVIRSGAKRAHRTGLTKAEAWGEAKRLAEACGATAYLFDEGGRICERVISQSGSDVVAVSHDRKAVLTKSGAVCPIPNLIGPVGDDARDAREATVAVAMIAPDRWAVVDLGDYEMRVMQ